MLSVLNIFTVSFFGHRYINVDDYSLAEKRVDEIVQDLICTKEYVDFLVGRDGDFDQIVSSSIKRVQKKYDYYNSSHVCVLPYARATYLNNIESFEEYYNEVEICIQSSMAYPKRAIQIRNRYMIDRSDLCVFYVDHNSGGAWQTMQYAIGQGKKIIQLVNML